LLKNKQDGRIALFNSLLHSLLMLSLAIIISTLFVLSFFTSTIASIILNDHHLAALAFKPTPAPQQPITQQRNVQQVQYSFVRTWGSVGTGDGQFQGPGGIAVDSSGNVYVADPAITVSKNSIAMVIL
jgi:NHL repeat